MGGGRCGRTGVGDNDGVVAEVGSNPGSALDGEIGGDACSAATPAAHAASLESLGLLAEIVTADELLAKFAERSTAVPP